MKGITLHDILGKETYKGLLPWVVVGDGFTSKRQKEKKKKRQKDGIFRVRTQFCMLIVVVCT